MKKILSAIALASLAVGVQAAPVDYVINEGHTFARFSYDHLGMTRQEHRFDVVRGKVMLDAEAQKAELDISIRTDSVSTGFKTLDGLLMEQQYFDAYQYPNITFKSRSVKFDGKKPVSIEGDLMIRGITKPVTFQVVQWNGEPHPLYKRPNIGGMAVAKVSRSAYGMAQYVPFNGDEVTITVSLEAMDTPPPVPKR